jgi:hypothetical protein
VRAVVVAGLVATVVVAAGWTLQTVGLPRAGRGNIAAARASEWLLRYRFTESTLTLRGRVERGRCFHGWFNDHGHWKRGTLLVLDSGASIAAVGRHDLAVDGAWSLAPLAALELAGCTNVLGPRLASLAVSDDDVHVGRSSASGRPVLTLHLDRMTLLVNPRTKRPLGLELAGARSTIQVSRLTRREARAMEGPE